MKAAEAQGIAGKTYNGGNGKRYSLNYVWDLLQKIEGVSLPAIYAPDREGDVRDSQADTAAARRDLDHRPQFSLIEGLRNTLSWYRATYQRSRDSRPTESRVLSLAKSGQ